MKRFAKYLMLRLALLVTAILIYTIPTKGQFEHKLLTSNLLLESKVHYGFVYPHHIEMELFNAHFPAFEISCLQQTFGKHRWERDYSYPIIGATLFYSPIGNHPSLGQAIALMPLVNFPLYRKGNLMIGFRFALGVGYITRPFNRIDNYRNLAIGSHFNAAVNLMAELRYRINDRFTFTGGISLQHFSNGSLKLPNYGLNAPFANVGFAYKPFKENSLIDDRFIPPTHSFEAILRRSFEVNVGILAGFKNMQAIYGENYMVYHLFSNGFHRISPKSKAGIGLDFSYDPSQITKLEMDGVEVTNKLNIIRPGVNIAYQLVMSRVGCIFNLGYYLGGMEKSNGPLYEKLSIQYNFSDAFFMTAMLKVHWGRADYIGWGIGYNFSISYGKKTIK